MFIYPSILLLCVYSGGLIVDDCRRRRRSSPDVWRMLFLLLLLPKHGCFKHFRLCVIITSFLLLLLLLLDAKIRAKLRLPRGMEILFIYMSRSDFWKSKTKVNIINIASIYKKKCIDFANGRGLFLLFRCMTQLRFFLVFLTFLSLFKNTIFFILLLLLYIILYYLSWLTFVRYADTHKIYTPPLPQN